MKRLLLFVFAIVAFAACEQAPIEEQSAIRQDAPETLTVGFEGDDTRVQLNKAQKTVWNSGDEVSVFYRSNGNQKWQYKGEDGVRQANLSRVQDATGNTAITKTIVVYPYNETYWLNTDSYCIEATAPATQHYAVDSYGIGDNLMVSQGEFTQFSLKNVYGWLKLQLTGDGETIKSIKFRGNDGEQVAGLIYVDTATAEATLAAEMGDADDNNAGGNLVFEDTILTEVTLNCGEGVALGKNATAFYIALPPQTFTQGFTVEITDNSDYTMEQSTDKALTIERNTIKPMAAFEFINPATPSAPAPASNEIWYTATAKVEPTFDDALTFGADVVSNVWDSETKRGIIAFDGDVTMIGVDAFNNCDKLTGVTLPECVTSIGKNAFYDCDGLIEFTIPDSVTSIGDYAFRDCDSLKSVNIGNSVTTIGNGAFRVCKSLKEFKGKFATEDGRSLIVNNTIIAYANASGTTYTIPDSVTTIEESAFYNCDSLTSVNIHDSVTTIGSWAFYDCDSLKSVNIGDSVTSIGTETFRSCASLKQVYCYAPIPPSSSSAFYDNASGRRIYVYEECVELYKSEWSSFKDSIYPNGKNCPETTTIQYTTNDGNTITSSKLPIISNIYDNGVGTMVIAGEITKIPNSAFYNCDSMTSVNIPDSVTTIGNDAFFDCDSLTSVNIPDSVTTIGNHAFYYCKSLTSVYSKATTPPALGGTYVFYSNGSGRKIYVPAESVEAYKSATNWNEYASRIVGYDFENGVIVE